MGYIFECLLFRQEVLFLNKSFHIKFSFILRISEIFSRLGPTVKLNCHYNKILVAPHSPSPSQPLSLPVPSAPSSLVDETTLVFYMPPPFICQALSVPCGLVFKKPRTVSSPGGIGGPAYTSTAWSYWSNFKDQEEVKPIQVLQTEVPT